MGGLACKEMTAAEYLSNLAMPRNYHDEGENQKHEL